MACRDCWIVRQGRRCIGAVPSAPRRIFLRTTPPSRRQGIRLGQGLDTDPPVVRIQPEGCPVVEVEVKEPVGRDI